MSEVPLSTGTSRLSQVIDFARSTEPRRPVSRRAMAVDVMIAVLVLAASLYSVRFFYPGFVWATVTSVPLVVRRRFPLATFLTVLLGVLASRSYATDISFAAVIFAAYTAVVYSRHRAAALLAIVPAGVLITVDFWRTGAARTPGRVGGDPFGFQALQRLLIQPGHPPGPRLPGNDLHGLYTSGAPWRLVVLLVLVSFISIAVVGTAVYAGDRFRRLRDEHEAATRQALQQERARIASELHDVVTHNVSVMVVQAGAARQVLTAEPDQARAALLAVEASGRAAMAELRNLLGLLSPASDEAAEARAGASPGEARRATSGRKQAELAPATADLWPQPGLAQVESLIERVTATGLPVDLRIGVLPDDLPPGVDLAAFRVVQEGLTNVIKHAGKPKTSVTLDHRDQAIVLEVTDSGAPIPAAVPAVPSGGRGLIGLRERLALYGGELDAGPVLGGGWRVRARIPVDAAGGSPSCGGSALSVESAASVSSPSSDDSRPAAVRAR